MYTVTQVVNIRIDPYDVYIGRAGKGQSGYFGNPFNGLDRNDNIKKFKTYFYDRIRTDHEYRFRVQELRDKRLGCFCHPKNCHGDVYVEYLDSLPEDLKQVTAVVGSRSFDNYEFMKRTLGFFHISKIVSGGAKGADLLAKRYALEHQIAYQEFLPNWEMLGKKAGFVRNKLIIDASQQVIAYHDGESRGTKHSITLAQEAGKPYYVLWPPPQDKVQELLAEIG